MANIYRNLTAAGWLYYLIVGGNSPALAAPGDMEALAEASDLDADPADVRAIGSVCTACHSASQFLTAPRTYLRWEQTMQDMLDRGAVATDEQLDRILSYLVKNITIVNVNASSPEQLAMTLQIPNSVASEISARRVTERFVGVDDLASVKGVDRQIIEKLFAKNLLQF